MYNNKERDYDALANNLLGNIENLLQGWLQDGKRVGNEYRALNPTRADSKVGSFSVNLKNGKWSDFATGDAGGNLISLYSYLFGCKNSEAYDTLTGENNYHTNFTQHNYQKIKKEVLEEWKLLNLPYGDEPTGEHFQLGMPYAAYQYEDFYIFRYLKEDGTKDIRPMTYRENVTTGERAWRWKAKENNRALYNKKKINNEMPVLIVEGEKAGNVIVAGYTTVSWAGGSNAIDKTDWTPLAGRDDVYLWADRDKAGLKTVGKIQSILPRVKIIPVDFSINDGQDIADITHKEIQDKLQYFIQSQTVEVEKVKPKEIVVRYSTKYPDIKRIDSGVIIAKTGAGKTFNYEGVAEYLIIVPRAEQTTVEAGENGNFLIDKILDSGAIITFNKFYGHYNNNPEFRELVDKKIIKVVVDEAHLLVAVPSRMHKLIYNLDAVFMSGTLEPFFREDLQRYKYVPAEPETIYYTDNFIPKIEGSLIFADNKKALIKNYPNNCVVSKTHKHECVNVATTREKYVIATSCLREGISVKNDNFKACIVYANGCNLWSTKDILQGVHRVRSECLRLVTKKPDEQYTKYINFDWWLKFVNENSSDDVALNAVFGEYYSSLIRITHKQNKYVRADEYGIACYLSHLTRNNYDKDFYNFVELTELIEEFKINLDTKGIEEDEEGENGSYETKDGIIWEFDIKKKPKFLKWVESYESGLVDRIAKLDSFKNFKDIYEGSRVVRYIKKAYSQSNKKRGQKYSIDMFYKLLKELVQFEMIDDVTGKKVERIGAKNSHKNVSIRVIKNHPDYIRKSNKK